MAYNDGLKPWNRLAWSDETMQMIYREWGKFYSKRHIMDKASAYYTKSMIVDENDPGCLHNRSVALVSIAKSEKALHDSAAALAIKRLDCPINLQYSVGFFYNNDFEQCLTTLHNNSRRFKGGKLKPFKEQINVLESTFNQNLSESLQPFALKNRKTFIEVGKMIKDAAEYEPKIRWKQLRDEGRCDVESVEIPPNELLHPREHERRKLAYKIANQKYIGRSWVDLVFLSKLRFDKTLLLKQTPVSTKLLRNQVQDKFTQVTKFVKMLQARDPLYDLRSKNCPNVKLLKKVQDDHLSRIQSRTRRDMFTFLDKIKDLRRRKKILELRDYIESVMRNYTIIKTKRVMPWKYEFICEVYNVIALAYMDQLTIPDDIMNYPLKNRLYKLLHIEPLKEKETRQYVFGDKSTYQPPDAVDYDYIAYKNHVNLLEKWLKYVRYDVEKCFIYLMISYYHLEHNKLEDCVQVAVKGRNVARDADLTIWNLLANLQIIKAQTLQNKYDILVLHYKNVINLLKKWEGDDDIQMLLQMASQFNNLIRAQLKNSKKGNK